MFFKRKIANRRVAKRGPLYLSGLNFYDSVKKILMILIGLGSAFGIYEFFALSPYLKVNQVEVLGSLNHISREALLNLAQVPYGKNLFAVDLYALGQNIKRYPWIAEVEVRRHLPEGLVIHVLEHQPAAILEVSEGSDKFKYLVSTQATVFRLLENEEGYGLPVIAGFSKENLRKFPVYYQKQLKEGLHLIRGFNQVVGEEGYALKRVQIQEHDGFSAYLQKQQLCGESQCPPLEIFFGKGEWPAKFENLVGFLERMKSEEMVFRKLDLHVAGKIFARM